MNNKHTLKELADMFAYERRRALTNCQSVEEARLLALRHVLDAIGYEFPKDEEDEEREAFDAWYQAAQIPQGETQAFAAWKAGRELLRKEVCSDQCEDNSAWIPWDGGDKSPIVGERTKYQVKYRDGVKSICVRKTLSAQCWSHRGIYSDIIAYRILKP